MKGQRNCHFVRVLVRRTTHASAFPCKGSPTLREFQAGFRARHRGSPKDPTACRRGLLCQLRSPRNRREGDKQTRVQRTAVQGGKLCLHTQCMLHFLHQASSCHVVKQNAPSKPRLSAATYQRVLILAKAKHTKQSNKTIVRLLFFFFFRH